MKKFPKPFDAYKLGVERPIAVEFNPQLGHYHHLFDNPVYYFNALQFMRGEIYRAILGYERVWDADYERTLVLQLDKLLCGLAEKRTYYLEEIEVAKSFDLFGLKWQRDIKPHLNFNFAKTKRVRVGIGRRATVRVNLCDAPYHADVEFDDGRIFSVTFGWYLNWKRNKYIRSIDHADTNISQPGITEPSPGTSEDFPAGTLVNKVFDLRERIKRSHSLSKTRKTLL